MTNQTTTTAQTATELLHQQHGVVKEMFERLSTATGTDKAELFDCLRSFLAVHETAEEIVVHPQARRAGGNADAIVDARLKEEDEAKTVLADLEKIGPQGAGFDAKLAKFQKAAVSHAEAEEREVFPLLEKCCDRETLVKMADRLRKAEQLAPTHPHPHGPEGAIGNLLVGPFAAMVDKVRDKLES
jgi:hemerythrin superfamily protein